MTDLRVEFERVLAEQQRLGFVSYHQCETWSEKHKCYHDDDLDNTYRMFIASRAALKVELPATCNRALIIGDGDYNLEYEHDEYFEVDDIKQMLTDAGISYE